MSLLRETSSGVYDRTATGVAWSGTLLGVAKVDGSNARAISFATYGSDLTQFTADRRIADASFTGVTALLWNGSEFGLFYESPSGQLYLQRISANGDPIGPAVAIAPNHSSSTEREYDVAWDATLQAYVIVHSVITGTDKGMWLTMVNSDGTPRSDEQITIVFSAPAAPRIAVNANGTIAVLFRRPATFSFRIYDAAGIGGNVLPIMNAREVRIATSGTTFTVVGNTPSNAPLEIDWAAIDDRGTVTMSATKLFVSKGAEIAPVSLFWNDARGEWALGYLESRFPFNQVAGDYRLRRFTSSGSLISDSTFSPDPLQTRLATPLPFAWTGSSYTTAASRSASSSVQPESYVIRHCPLAASVGTQLTYVRAGDLLTLTADVEGGATDRTYAWDLGDGTRATTSTLTHRYDRLGDYTVTLRVTDSAGATSVATLVIHVVTPRRRAVHR